MTDKAIKDEKAKKKRTSPGVFVQQVRSETSKVTWPTRSEWTVTTIMVFIMVTLAAIFFFVTDVIINQIVQFIIGLSG